MRISSKKLSLGRQTLRTLTSEELARQVRGGMLKIKTNVNGDCAADQNSQTDGSPLPVPQTIADALEDMKPKNLAVQVANP